MDVARGEHGIATVVELGFVEAPGDAALAIGQLSGYSLFHSKSLAVIGVGKGCYSSNTGKRGRISSFYEITPLGRENLACFRPRQDPVRPIFAPVIRRRARTHSCRRPA